MKYRNLGSSDLRISEVCLGTMTWANQNTEEQAHAQIDRFIELGGNFIDTAELYPVPPDVKYMGKTEEFIGNWLEKHQDMRSKLIIATKVSGPTPKSWQHGGVVGLREKALGNGAAKPEELPLPRLVPDQIKRALAASLKRLKTTYVDLYQLHWPDRYTPLWGNNQYRKNLEGKHQQQPERQEDDPERTNADYESVVKCMGELIEQGLIKAWGLSNETTFGVCKWCSTAERLGLPKPVSIQNDFSLLDRRFESELAEACSDRHYNLGLLAYGCLNGGTLSGKYLDSAKPDGARHTLFPKFQSRYHSERSMQAAKEYAAIAEKHGVTPTQLALAWAYGRFYMGAVIIGATTMEQLEENCKACEVELPKEALNAIDAVHVRIRNPNLQD